MTSFSMKCIFSIPFYLFFLLISTGLDARTLQVSQNDSIPPASGKLSDWDVAVETVHLADDAKWMRDSFEQRVAQSEARRSTLERALAKAEADTTVSAYELKTLKDDLKSAQKTEKEDEKNLKRAKSVVEFTESVANKESKLQRSQLPKSRKQVEQIRNLLFPEQKMVEPVAEQALPEKKEPAITVADAVQEAPMESDSSSGVPKIDAEPNEKRRGKAKLPQQPAKVFKVYDEKEDVMINPPAPPCVLASNIRDEFSGEVRKEMPRNEIFRYTNPALRKMYTDKAHTIGEASLLSMGTNAALHLTFRINDPNVRRTQGSLQKNGVAILKFMDGNSISLNNSRSDEGVTDPEGKSVVYQAQFPIDRTTIKKLRTTELDKIRVAWTNGYEDYDVQQVDLLMWQAKCLFEQF